jgi:subtilisin family serine protease
MPYFYGLHGKKIELLSPELDLTPGVLGYTLRLFGGASVEHDVTRLSRATTTFFGSPEGAGTERKTRPRRPPSLYRDGRTKLLRCFYRELVIRFGRDVSEEKRRGHLADFALETVSINPFVPNQIVVRDPYDKRRGDELIGVANALAERDGDVILAVPNFVSEFRRSAAPAIPSDQWHLDNTGHFSGQTAGEDVRAKQAWGIAIGSPAIIVAVLDDGVDIDHPALKNQIWRNLDRASTDQFGRDFFLETTDPGHFDPRPKVFLAPFNDPTRNDIHGTACAGLVASNAPDGRAFGVAPGCRILPVKILHADELASDEKVSNAIHYAAGIADILSCSWIGPETPLIENAIEDAVSTGRSGKGCAVFCAVGNDGKPEVGFPANTAAAVAVGASTDAGARALYCNFGPEMALVAPSNGGIKDVFTCDVSLPNRGFNLGVDADGGADGFYTNGFGGTSAATPIAAGVAAVVLSQQPTLTAGQLKSLLEQTADKIGGGFDNNGHSDLFGFGRVNLFSALGGVAPFLKK